MRQIRIISIILAVLAMALLAGTALADAPVNATPITPGEQTIVNISEAGAFQYFSLTPTETAMYSFTSHSEMDTYALLYDARMFALAVDDDSAPEGGNFQLIYPLEAGETYYFAAGFYSWDRTGSFPVQLENRGTLLAIAAESYVYTTPGNAVTLRVIPLSDDSSLTYQWYRMTGNGMTPLAGETRSSLILLAPTRMASYICRVSDGSSTQDVSIETEMESDYWLFPDCETEIFLNPDSQPVTLSVRAASDVGSVSYQWYHWTHDADGNEIRKEIPGATGNTYNLSNPRSGDYYCEAINGDGKESSVGFTLTVDNGFRVSRVGSDSITIARGESTTLSVQAQASVGELSYQWYTVAYDEYEDAIYSLISGATGETYATGSLTKNTSFACRVTDIYGNSREVSFWVEVEGGDSGFSIEPVGSDEIEIESGADVQMAVTASNAVGAVTYRWYRGEYNEVADRYFYTRIPDATGASYTATGVTRRTSFRCVAECGDDQRNVDFEVTPSDGLEITRVPEGNIQIDNGGSAELEVTVSGETGDVSYQWFRENMPIPGANESTYTCEGIYGYTKVHCRVQDDNGVHWGTFYLHANHTDNEGLSVSAIGDTDIAVAPEASVTLKVEADENLTYQWAKREKLPYGYYSETTVIDGANQPTLNISAVTRISSYYCNVTDGTNTACVAFSIDINSGLTVKSALTDEATTVYVEPNSTTQLGVTAATQAGSLSYQWNVSRFDEDEGYWYGAPIPGATGASYTTPAVTEYIKYYCEVKDGYNEETIWFDVYPDSGFSAEPVTDTEFVVEPGKSFTMRVKAETQIGTLAYQWSISDYNDEDYYWYNSRPIDGADGDSYTVTDFAAKARYTCHVSDGYNSADIVFTADIDSGLTVEGDYNTHYDAELGDDITMSVTATTKMPGGVTYQWYKAEINPSTGEMSDYMPIPNANGASYTAHDISAKGNYYCGVSDGISSTERYFNIDIIGIELIISGDDQFLFVSDGGSTTLHANATTSAGSLHYQWYQGTKTISGQTGADYTLSNFSGSAMIWCRIWNDFGQSGEIRFLCASNAIAEEIEAGETATASITKSNSLALFRFIPEATSQYTLTSASSSDTYGYLFSEDGGILMKDDDDGEDSNFRIEATLVAGQTYYWVTRYYSRDMTGSFDVVLTQGEAVEFTTVQKGALALRVGQSVVMPNNLNWEQPSAAISGDTSVLTTRGATVTAVAPGTAQLSVMYLDSGENCVYNVTVYPDEGVLRLPASLTEIEDEAFEGDASIRFVELGSTVESIGAEAFAGTGIVQIVIASNNGISTYDDSFGDASPTVVCPMGSAAEYMAIDRGLNVVYLP